MSGHWVDRGRREPWPTPSKGRSIGSPVFVLQFALGASPTPCSGGAHGECSPRPCSGSGLLEPQEDGSVMVDVCLHSAPNFPGALVNALCHHRRRPSAVRYEDARQCAVADRAATRVFRQVSQTPPPLTSAAPSQRLVARAPCNSRYGGRHAGRASTSMRDGPSV